MKRTENVRRKRVFLSVALTLALVMGLGLFADSFAMVSRAESQGKVIANSANIRKEANGTSQVIGSTEKDKIITIRSQVQGSDGYIWYQTFVNSETLGYIRSDLVEITDGSTPTTETPTTETPPAPSATPSNETPAEVTAVNPVSATVSGGSSVRVRSNASTTSQILKTVPNGLALTVTGTANGSDGKVWYQVSFNANNADVTGFIRSDYVSLSGDLTPYTEEPEPEPETPVNNPEEPVSTPEPEPIKNFDTMLIDGTWYLIDNTKETPEKHDIQGLFDKVTNNAAAYDKANKAARTEKVVIIILVFLIVAAGAVIALLIFKMKDMMDEAYFSEVENETMRRRETNRPKGGFEKVMHTVGAEKPGAGRPTGQRADLGQRSAGASQGGGQSQRPTQGQRPAGQRSAGASQGGGQSQRPTGQRPAGVSQGGGQSQRPTQGQRPAGASQGGGQSQRPTQGQRPAGAPQGGGQSQRPAGTPQAGQKSGGNQQGWQSKNFMSDDDDEFEFEFLNYDGDEE